MSDYSFMQTGRNIHQGPSIDPNKIMGMLTLFIKNGMTNAARYVELCKRNGVTQDDVVYGLIYEVFEFLNTPNLENKIEESLEELNEEYNEEDDNLDDIILDDDQIESFSRIKEELNTDNDREFVTKMHHYFDNWDEWQPQDELEIILKNAINQSIISIKNDAHNDMDIDAMEVELN
jgi:hypothetical protein